MSKKRGKMAVQLFIITFAVIAVMIGALLVIQSVFFERFYMSWKTSKLEKQLELFVDEVASESLSYSQFLQLRQSFFYENNASINVVRENGSSFEQQLRENQKWLSVLIEYEDGTEKKIVLSEYEIYTNLMGATLDIGATYYIMANDSGDSYQFVLGMMGSEVFAQTGFVEMTGFENEPVVVMDWQEIEVLAIEEATQAERDNYHVSVGAGAVVVGRLLSDTFVDFGIFPFGTGDQINLKIDTASANGEQLSFYLTASLQPVDEASAAITSYYPWFFLVGVIAALIVAFVYARRVSGPIGRISKAAGLMSQGNLDVRVRSKHSNEIGVLAESLNQLSSNLQSTIGELEGANIKLQGDIDEKEKQEQIRREFTANVSHDLKTPLGVMRCYLELLRDDIEPTKKDAYFDIMQGEIDKMNKMIMQMLQLAKAESRDTQLNKTKVDIEGVMRDAAAIFEPQMQEKQLTLSVGGRFERMYADEQRMEQVAVNLIGNAAEYALPGTQIEIVGEVTNGVCRVCVANRCEPISQEQADELFKRFHTLDKSRNMRGTGLGLAICAAIFELHKINYGVTSEKERISFWFEYSAI